MMGQEQNNGRQTASVIEGAVKTGKAVAELAKGISSGPAGTAAALWKNRHTVAKGAGALAGFLLLPILFLLMLPSVIFGGLTAEQDTVILNNDGAIMENISQAQQTVWTVVYESHDEVVDEIQAKIALLRENECGIMVDPFTGSLNANSLSLLSQYSASKDYSEISIPDLEKTVRDGSDGLFSYSASSSSSTNAEGQAVTTYQYTVEYGGEEYFADEVFHLDDKAKEIAREYTANLSLYLYGSVDGSFGTGAQVSEEVLQYAALIRKYAQKYGISQYFDLICAVMMAESGGRGTDPMQSSECGYNTRYPNSPGAIREPEYSIDCGVHVLADVLKEAGCTSPTDTARISLALQGYNFGNGYIPWAIKNYGGYTQESAIAFSEKMKKELGWEVYGNPQYVQAVLRYYLYPIGGGKEGWGSPFVGKDWRSAVTSEFGFRYDPITGEADGHTGIDIGYPEGTPINAVKSGVVEYTSGETTYGNHLVIDHGNGVKTLYAHCSRILVSAGQRVVKGEVIALVGQTGRVTGPHLHLNVEIDGELKNPREYLN